MPRENGSKKPPQRNYSVRLEGQLHQDSLTRREAIALAKGLSGEVDVYFKASPVTNWRADRVAQEIAEVCQLRTLNNLGCRWCTYWIRTTRKRDGTIKRLGYCPHADRLREQRANWLRKINQD